MHKAVIINSDYQNPAPTAKEIQAYLHKSSKLLYGNDKRKSINTPYKENIHLVMHSFYQFEEALTGRTRDFGTTRTLYIFDDKVNETHFFLKYVGQIQTHFKLNDPIITEMNKCSWDYGHLYRYKQSLEHDFRFIDFLKEKNIGNAKLHKAFPKFTTATNEYINKIDIAMKEIEDKAVALFKSGW
jgi:hypothetical protein